MLAHLKNDFCTKLITYHVRRLRDLISLLCSLLDCRWVIAARLAGIASACGFGAHLLSAPLLLCFGRLVLFFVALTLDLSFLSGRSLDDLDGFADMRACKLIDLHVNFIGCNMERIIE